MQAVGVYLRGLRDDRKLTQAEAAALIGVSSKTVERWEAGKHEPPASELAAYVKVLGGEVAEAVRRLLGELPLTDADTEWFASLSPEQKRKARALLDVAEGRRERRG